MLQFLQLYYTKEYKNLRNSNNLRKTNHARLERGGRVLYENVKVERKEGQPLRFDAIFFR